MRAPMTDVIVLLPGIMGSALAKGGRSVWDLTAGAISHAAFSLGSSIQDLRLSSDTSTGDGVTATRLLPDAHLVPFWWKIDGYAEVAEFIRTTFDVSPGENFFEFPYDWRLDNRIAARRLEAAANDWLEDWRRHQPTARLILIGHSMGGLVARYFVEVLGGWVNTKLLITLGTPHRGSVKALDFLVNGLTKKLGSLTLINLTKLLQSFPSSYQLLPIYPCVGKGEDDLQALEYMPTKKVGGLDVERARAGIEFHREIERSVKANSQNPGYMKSRYRLLPVVGTYQPTFQSALLTEDGVKPLYTYKGKSMLGGDGTVPRLSATPIELSGTNAETFVACPHATLQNFDPVRIQIRAALEDVDISEIKAVGPEAISLDMTDAFLAGESVEARARCQSVIEPMRAVVANLETGAALEYEFDVTSGKDDWQELRIPSLAAGGYRIRVEAGDETEPISDLFVVVD